MGMGGSGYLVALLVVFMVGISCCNGYVFYVGGRSGWVVDPPEDYHHWAEKSRFQVNDKLVFIYKVKEDSALHVTKEDYHSCNTSSPLRYMGSGRSVFTLDKSGPFYFISGAIGHCSSGQKMMVIVMAHWHHAAAPSPASPPHGSPSPILSPSSSPSPSPNPGPSPPATVPTPQSEAPSPFEEGGVPSPSPMASGATMLAHCTDLGALLWAVVVGIGALSAF